MTEAESKEIIKSLTTTINNLNEEFVYQMSMDVDLNDENNGMATNGYVYKTQNTQGTQYQFFRVN